ncbi:MAG: GNAT family N-acetyltransferase [Clostridiales bacterium]|jgi:ribosomal protein S18 acetylase RimI-like enzyme|nr:GNAT family N-acetyltransferase [Clostridiales bacterium]
MTTILPCGQADIPDIADLERRVIALPWGGRQLFAAFSDARYAFYKAVFCGDDPLGAKKAVFRGDDPLGAKKAVFRGDDPAGARKNALAGYILAEHVLDETNISSIAVEPALWGLGIGTALLGHVIGSERARGAVRILLEVEAQNAAALKLYQSAGFQNIAVRPDYYGRGRDGLIFEKTL